MTIRGVMLVRTEGRSLGIPLSDVTEVCETGAIQAVPATIPALRGVTTVRGRLVPLFHLGALIGGRACPSGAPAATMLLARVVDRWVALEVDTADAAPHEEILTTFLDRGAESWTLGAVRRPDGWVPILNLEALAARWQALEKAS